MEISFDITIDERRFSRHPDIPLRAHRLGSYSSAIGRLPLRHRVGSRRRCCHGDRYLQICTVDAVGIRRFMRICRDCIHMHLIGGRKLGRGYSMDRRSAFGVFESDRCGLFLQAEKRQQKEITPSRYQDIKKSSRPLLRSGYTSYLRNFARRLRSFFQRGVKTSTILYTSGLKT